MIASEEKPVGKRVMLMGTLKMDHILDAKPDILTSGDMSCLMLLHAIEILRDTLPGKS